jgi:hypothetical protein
MKVCTRMIMEILIGNQKLIWKEIVYIFIMIQSSWNVITGEDFMMWPVDQMSGVWKFPGLPRQVKLVLTCPLSTSNSFKLEPEGNSRKQTSCLQVLLTSGRCILKKKTNSWLSHWNPHYTICQYTANREQWTSVHISYYCIILTQFMGTISNFSNSRTTWSSSSQNFCS